MVYKSQITSHKPQVGTGNQSSIFPGLLRVLAMTAGVVFVLFGFSAKTASASALSKPANNLGLVAYYSFEDATGTKATDFSGMGYTGTLAGDTRWVDGARGKALSFDGAGDYVQFAVSYVPRINFSVIGWFKTSTTHQIDTEAISGTTGTSGQKYAVDPKYYDVPASSAGSGLSIGTNGISVYEHSASYLAPPAVYSGNIGTGWNQIAYVYQNNQPKIYLNGVLVRTGLTSLRSTVYGPTYIAGGTSGYTNFAGQIDDLRIYNRVLDATEIANLYTHSGAAIRKNADNTGLVGYWNFNEATGTVAHDFSGKGNTGTLTGGPVWTGGKLGKALYFDGSNDYITMGTPSALNNLGPMTVSFWINPQSANASSILGKQSGSGDVGWVVSFVGSGISFTVRAAGDPLYTQSYRVSSSGLFGLNSYSHITVTWDGSIAYTGIHIFINGQETSYSASSSNLSSLGSDSAIPFQIGQTGTGSYFGGLIDDVRVYNRVLSATEVAKLYQATQATINSSQNTRGPQSGLVGLWSFDGRDVYGTTAYDRSGSGNNGTLTNGPTPASGKIGQGMQFDGVDDYVVVDDNDALSPSQHTLSAWIKFNATPNSDTVISKRVDTNSSDEYNLFYASTGFEYRVGGNTSPATYTITPVVGRWYHILGTYNGSNSQLYLDGVAVGSAGSPSSPSNGTAPINIGRLQTNGTYYFNGLIDDVRLYNRALSTSEIQLLYNLGR